MKLVLGVGNSEDSMFALRDTLSLIAKTNDHLTVAILTDLLNERTPDDIERVIEEELACHDDPSVDIVHLDGEAGPAIAELAAHEDYDRIVLGGGTRSPLGKIVMGDVAEYVLLNADTSVTLIR